MLYVSILLIFIFSDTRIDCQILSMHDVFLILFLLLFFLKIFFPSSVFVYLFAFLGDFCFVCFLFWLLVLNHSDTVIGIDI